MNKDITNILYKFFCVDSFIMDAVDIRNDLYFVITEYKAGYEFSKEDFEKAYDFIVKHMVGERTMCDELKVLYKLAFEEHFDIFDSLDPDVSDFFDLYNIFPDSYMYNFAFVMRFYYKYSTRPKFISGIDLNDI